MIRAGRSKIRPILDFRRVAELLPLDSQTAWRPISRELGPLQAIINILIINDIEA
jgi:hypothetical protein